MVRAVRRRALSAAVVVGAALASVPVPADALTVGEARHLLARTGFGSATWAEIEALRPLTRRQAVDRLLRQSRREATLSPPAWVADTPKLRPPRGASREERRAFRRARRQEALTLVSWWYREMAATPSPLTERMTLFWHNHFTSSFRKVRSPLLLYRQNVTLRRYALDNFRVLTHAMAQDPAMVVYLDNVRNRRGKPNENFARELLELFTLGEGRYSERDIKEAARAFTGWSLDRQTGAFRFRSRLHDAGAKHFMGRTGRFNGDAIIEIVLKRPEVATYITRKAWRAFISETPDSKKVAAIAHRFRMSGYDIKTLMRGLLLSRAFWAPEIRGRLIKSPVDLIVGTMRQFRVSPPQGRVLFRVSRALGQVPFMPPNVKGWPGGKRWITANSLLMRRQVLLALLSGRAGARRPERQTDRLRGPDRRDRQMRGMSGRMPAIDLDRWVASGPAVRRNGKMLTTVLLAVPPVRAPAGSDDPARFVRTLLLDVAYQLK